MTSGGSKAPRPSPAQDAASAAQADLLRQQQGLFEDIARNANLLQPGLFEEIGLRPIFNDTETQSRIESLIAERSGLQRNISSAPSAVPGGGFPRGGNRVVGGTQQTINPRIAQIDKEIASLQDQLGQISGFERLADQNRLLSEDIETQFLKRTQAALAGELPVNPALLRQLEEEKQTFENNLIADFGSLDAARNSDPGQRRINQFKSFNTETLENARRGDLTFAQGGALQQGQFNETLQDLFLGRAQGVLNLTSPAAQGFGQTASGFGNQAGQLAQQSQFNAQFKASQPTLLQSLGGLTGTLAGSFLGGSGGASLFNRVFPA